MYAITKKQYDAICTAIEFVDAFVEYHLEDVPFEDVEETDAQRLNKILPSLRNVLSLTEYEPPCEEVRTVRVVDTDDPAVRSYVDTCVWDARNSVNPNYRYCCVDHELHECWLTDDLEQALTKARTNSMCGGKMCGNKIWYVLNIRKISNGTYKTFYECIFMDGDLVKRKGDFLHYNYIETSCGANVFKI